MSACKRACERESNEDSDDRADEEGIYPEGERTKRDSIMWGWLCGREWGEEGKRQRVREKREPSKEAMDACK